MDHSDSRLRPLPYHQKLCSYFETREPELWRWFASAEAMADYSKAARLELLKSTYRLSPESHEALYAATGEVAGKLGIEVPCTLYQSQVHAPGAMNAMLRFLPGEVHIVFAGPVIEDLSEAELRAVLGHELAHFRLFSGWEGRFLVAERVVCAMAADPRAENCHMETYRRFQLYSEVFADRGSVLANDDVAPAVSCMVKVSTGLSSVDPQAYIDQAREILTDDSSASKADDHPEGYIRALAASLWADEPDDCEEGIRQLIAGTADLSSLDVLDQIDYTDATRRLLRGLLAPRWFRSATVLGLARLYFDDFEPLLEAPDWLEFASQVDLDHESIRQYFGVVLLDFALVDPDLEDAPLAACLAVADACGFLEEFEGNANQLGKVTKKQLAQVKRARDTILAAAASQEVEDE